jgi:hypothetical protein
MSTLKDDLKAALADPVAIARAMSDDEIEAAVRKILADHPPEDDHLLTPEDREWMKKARVTVARRDAERSRAGTRDPEPSEIREGK